MSISKCENYVKYASEAPQPMREYRLPSAEVFPSLEPLRSGQAFQPWVVSKHPASLDPQRTSPDTTPHPIKAQTRFCPASDLSLDDP